MRLSLHFTLEEVTKSATALRLGIENKPNAEQIENLGRLARGILEPVRRQFGRPFSPSSEFRSPGEKGLNAAIGSKPSSQHTKGEAVDFEIPGVPNLEVAKWVHGHIRFDQLILEFYEPEDPQSGWVHVSLKAGNNRQQTLTINSKGVHPGLPQTRKET